MSLLTTLFDHVDWADAQALAALATLPESSTERARATRLYAHLAAAAHVWLARLEQRTPSYPVWPELTLPEATALAAESLAGLRALASAGDDTLAQEVEYRNSAGQAFRNTIADVLTHVALHASYHRGQLALLTRLGGGVPVNTDFITYVRGVPVSQR